MRIGIPKEIKDGEARVGATPKSVKALAEDGHEVRVQAGAGLGSGFGDEAYREAGATLVATAEEAYDCPLVVKVKELQPAEFGRLQPGTLLVGYQQLARDARLLEAVLERGVSCLAMEEVQAPDGSRPMLSPMSAIAGTMTAQIAAWALQQRPGPLCGSGLLLPRLPGGEPAKVLVIGEGVAGVAAARTFLALGCAVTLLGRDLARLEALAASLGVRTGLSTPEALTEAAAGADVIVGAVSIPGRLSPRLLTRAMLRTMPRGSVFIDIGIDMGGIAETSRQTYLSDPLYVEEGVLHYGVPNIPALVPRTATAALAEATLPYVRRLAGRDLAAVLAEDPGLARGLQVHRGQVVHQGLAEDTGRPFVPFPG